MPVPIKSAHQIALWKDKKSDEWHARWEAHPHLDSLRFVGKGDLPDEALIDLRHMTMSAMMAVSMSKNKTARKKTTRKS